MADVRILYFTGEEHVLYRCSGGSLAAEGRFANDESGATAFRESIASRRGGLFAVLADLSGEDFHEDQIPLLRGGDREAIVQRRLAQRYRDTRLATALPLGQAVTGERRNERLLLASFSNSQQFAPWLDALEEVGARLSGVFSVPLLAPQLAARLGAKSGRVLLVTANRAGLRQCFVDEGRLRFARLERTGDMAPEALAAFTRSESLRLVQYLSTLRALPRDGSALKVIVVAPAGQRPAFEAALASDARLQFRIVEAPEALRAVRLKGPPPEAMAEALYLQLAARKPPRDQFASREERRRYFIWQLQRGIVAAGALGFAGCAVAAGIGWLEARGQFEVAEAQRVESRAADAQYRRITAGFPVTQTTTENLRVAVVEFGKVAERTASPEPAFAHVSRVLEQFPQVELEGLQWSVGRLERGGKPAPAAAAAAPAAAGPGGKPPAGPLDQSEIIEVSGRVNAILRNDYRGITAQVQQLANALGTAGYEVARVQLPFDVTSEGTLTGNIVGAESTEAPRFTVVVARRMK